MQKETSIRVGFLLTAIVLWALWPHQGFADASIPSNGASVLRSLRPPLLHERVTSPFGWRLNPVRRVKMFHEGEDFGAPSGTPIYAAQAGTIEDLGQRDKSGIYLRIRHSQDVETVYAHVHRIMPGLRKGAVVRCGDIIAFVGSSGFTTGSNLHYEILVDGKPVDPRPWSGAMQIAGAP